MESSKKNRGFDDPDVIQSVRDDVDRLIGSDPVETVRILVVTYKAVEFMARDVDEAFTDHRKSIVMLNTSVIKLVVWNFMLTVAIIVMAVAMTWHILSHGG